MLGVKKVGRNSPLNQEETELIKKNIRKLALIEKNIRSFETAYADSRFKPHDSVVTIFNTLNLLTLSNKSIGLIVREPSINQAVMNLENVKRKMQGLNFEYSIPSEPKYKVYNLIDEVTSELRLLDPSQKEKLADQVKKINEVQEYIYNFKKDYPDRRLVNNNNLFTISDAIKDLDFCIESIDTPSPGVKISQAVMDLQTVKRNVLHPNFEYCIPSEPRNKVCNLIDEVLVDLERVSLEKAPSSKVTPTKNSPAISSIRSQ